MQDRRGLLRTRNLRTAAALVVAFATAAQADVLTVETAADALRDPPPNSLRHILTKVAKAGDTIRFAQNFVILMDDDTFEVAPALAGVRIEGPVQIRRDGDSGVLLIRAPGAVISKVSFRNVFVEVRSDSSGLARDINGVEVRESDFSLRGGIRMERAVGCVIDHCTLRADARWAGNLSPISLLGASTCRISGNTLEVLGPRQPVIALRGGGGTIVEDTIAADGDIVFEAESGVVRRNHLGAGRLDVTTEGQTGPFEIRGNECAELRALVVDVVVADNVVGGAAATGKAPGAGPKVPLLVIGQYKSQDTYAGPTVLTGNRVRGGRDASIRCATGDRTTSVVLTDNTVVEPAPIALSLSTSSPTTLTRTTITGDGAKGKGAGIFVFAAPAGGTRVEFSTITGVRGDGIVAGHDANVTLEGNTVQGCARSGFLIGRNARATSSRDVARENGGHGFEWTPKSAGSLTDGTVSGNKGAGVFVDAGAAVEIRRTSLTGNLGAGIDLAPRGVTPNAKRKTGNSGMAWPSELKFDTTQNAITGKAPRGAIIEVFRVEEGARAGNPGNGEGVTFLATGTADEVGEFAVKPRCKKGEKVTVTATLPGARPVTSEFSQDIECEEGPAIELVSVSAAGGPADLGAAFSPYGNRVVSGDGRFVVFTSTATNLLDGAVAGVTYVYRRDTVSGVTTRVTRSFDDSAFDPDEFGTNGFAGFEPSVSDDGRFVAYGTMSKKVIAGDKDGGATVVLFDAETGTTVAVTDPTTHVPPLPGGSSTHSGGQFSSISGDGSVVAFVSTDRDWVPSVPRVDEDVFVWTRATGVIERASGLTDPGVTRLTGVGRNESPRLSRDGRFVAFASYQNLVPSSTATGFKVYVRDRESGTTEVVSVDASGATRQGRQPAMSDDGRYVAFVSPDPLVATDTDAFDDVYVRDRQQGTVRRISVHEDGTSFEAGNSFPTISGDGRRVVFATRGSFQVPDGPLVLNISDLYLADLVAGTIEEASIGPDGEALGSTGSPRLSDDGRTLVFVSNATNLVEGGTPPTFQAYARRLGEP